MSTLTAKLGLTKPDPTENVDVAILNANYDAIDAAFSNFLTGAFKNAIRNGDMSIAQRGNGPFNTSVNSCTIDGIILNFTGGVVSLSRNPTSVASSTGANGAKFHASLSTAGQAAVGDLSALILKIEGVRKFAGKQVTLSFMVETGASGSKIGVEVNQVFGTGGAPSATVNTAMGAVVVTATGVYSITFVVPSIAGKTIGTNGDDSLNISLWFSAGATFAARASNIGIQNTVFNITDIQLELGAVATAFERLPAHVQLLWCQRYYERITATVSNNSILLGKAQSTTTAVIYWPFKVKKRSTTPTFNTSGAGSFYVTVATGGGNTLSSLVLTFTTDDSSWLSATTGVVLTPGHATELGAAAAAWIEVSAEL